MRLNRLSHYASKLKNSTVALLFVGTQIVFPLALSGVARAAAAATLEQCRNGTLSAPAVCADLGGELGWVSGNASSGNSHWREGDSAVYRILFSGLATTGAHSATISWDTTKDGHHAFDYLTTFNRTETTADACSGVVSCGSPSTYAIPNDTNAAITKVAGVFTLYNGTITGVSAYTLDGTYAGDSSTSITINFTAASATPVLAWGGHIASQVDWGVGNSASEINGSPYHMNLVKIDGGSAGHQDRSLSSGAIIVPTTPAIDTQVSSATLTVGGNVTDVATLTGDSSATPLAGTVGFYVCGPNATTNPDCTSGGTQVGTAVSVTPGSGYVGSATSAAYTASSVGNYCFRAEFAPSAGSPYASSTHTNLTTECFTVGDVTPPTGNSITIVKDSQPDSSQVFTFSGRVSVEGEATTETDLEGFTLVDDGSGSGANQKVLSGLTPGRYTIVETGEHEGWDLTSITCTGSSDYTVRPNAGNPHNVQINLKAGENVVCTFVNKSQEVPPTVLQKLTVIKHVVNTNGNNHQAADFTMRVSGTEVSDSSFPGNENGTTVTLGVGAYSVTEDNLPGYTVSYSAGCSGTLGSGDEVSCTVTNTANTPILLLTKTNNRPNPTVVGDTVTYSLVVTVPSDSGAVFNTTVTDLPPEHFTYVPGSWTADSSLRGDLKLAGITTEPTYGSPGIWNLGNLLPGEVITLTYQAKIGTDVSVGAYPDLAFVKGFTSPVEGRAVLGNLSSAVTPFVDTQVIVASISSPLVPRVYTAGTVVGPATLVNTGSNILMAQYGLPILLVGVVYTTRRSSYSQIKGGQIR